MPGFICALRKEEVRAFYVSQRLSCMHFGISDKASKSRKIRRLFRIALGSATVIIGFILSPVSWWNDLFVNVPLAYLLSYPFSLINSALFLPSFIFCYWLTNILGFILMHQGVVEVRNGIHNNNSQKRNNPKLWFLWFTYKRDLIASIVYTLAVLVLAGIGLLQDPVTLLNSFETLLKA
jgi:hypothetical protein